MAFILNTNKGVFVLEDGTTIDFCLTFCSQLKDLCKKVTNKLNALTRIAPYLSYDQRRLFYIFFFTGQLS